MASAWIERHKAASGIRYRVRYRLGGAESAKRYGGSFATLRLARVRRGVILADLAALRVPELAFTIPEPSPTVEQVAEAWRASRLDLAPNTRTLHRVALRRIYPTIGALPVDELTPDQVAELVGHLHGKGYKRGTVKHSLDALRQALDHHGLDPNPARHRRVRLPNETRPEIQPPSAAQVETALAAVAPRYRLPLLVLEACAMRIGELEGLTWGDVDEHEGRWRVHRVTAKSRKSRWVLVPPDLFAAVLALVPREDRQPDGPVFAGVVQAPLRTDLGRACRRPPGCRASTSTTCATGVSRCGCERAYRWPMSAPGPGMPG